MVFRKIEWRDMGWIDLAQDRDQWSALTKTAMKIWFP
jgi:hypothetical protein